jgi:putative ABC transport system permease protein
MWDLRMPIRFLRESWPRLALAVLALAAGVALVCAMDLVNRAVMRAFGEVIETMAGRAALQVTAGIRGTFPEEVAETVAAVPGVYIAVPVVDGVAYTTDGSGETLTVLGIDTANDSAIRVYSAEDGDGVEIADPLTLLSVPDSLIVTEAFARKRGLTIDDPVDLDTPAGRKTFTIRGLLSPKGAGRLFGASLAVMDLFAAQDVFARPGFVNRVDVVVERDADVDEVAQAITAALPRGLRTERPPQRSDALHDLVRSMHALLGVISMVGLIAAFLIIFGRLTTVFETRSWQLAVLRAVGVRRRAVWGELLKESIILGVLGVTLGVVVGIALGDVFRPIVAATTALTLEMVVPEGDVQVSSVSLALAALLGMGTALLAAVLPAWRASGVQIAEVIRSRGVEQPARGRAAFSLGRAGVAGAAVAALAAQHATGSPVWGFAGILLITIAAAVAARPFVRVNRLLVSALSRLGIAPTVRFGAAVVDQNPRRTALTIGMLGVGLGVVVWIWITATSFERSLAGIIRELAGSDLLVTSTHTIGGHIEAPFHEDVLARLREVPGVDMVTGSRVIDSSHGGTPIMLEGLDSLHFEEPRFGKLPIVGERMADLWQAVARGQAAIVSTSFLWVFGVRVGDAITLEAPSGAVRFQVAGATSFLEGPNPLVAFSREILQERWHDQQVNRAMIVLAPGAGVGRVREEIAARLGSAYGLRVLSPAEFVESNLTQMRRAFQAFHALGVLVLLVVLIGLADTLAASVLEARRQVGTLRALGVRRRVIRGVVLTEGVLLGSFGLLLAVATGVALSIAWVEATGPLLLGFELELHLPWRQMAILGSLAIAVSLLAGLFPARRAARLEPAVALRDE